MRGEFYEEERVIHEYPQLQFPEACDVFDGKKDFTQKLLSMMEAYKNEHSAIDAEIHFSEKAILLGDAGIGKTSLALRATEDAFSESYHPTIGVNFLARKFKIGPDRLQIPMVMNLWDTAGQERFRSLSSVYYRGASCCIICFDLSDPQTLDNAEELWVPEIKREAPGCRIFLVGLKCDLYRAVDRRRVFEVAKSIGAEYWECSARSGVMVRELFDRVGVFLFECCLHKYAAERARLSQPNYAPPPPTKVKVGKDTRKSGSPKKKSSCCS
jgi:small GTP-binding protein